MAVLDPRGESPDDMAARKELEFDARVALPEAQERYERAEAEVERLTQERDELAVELLDRPGTAKLRAEVERLREALHDVSRWRNIEPDQRETIDRLVRDA